MPPLRSVSATLKHCILTSSRLPLVTASNSWLRNVTGGGGALIVNCDLPTDIRKLDGCLSYCSASTGSTLSGCDGFPGPCGASVAGEGGGGHVAGDNCL
jgi:hypothetical protein